MNALLILILCISTAKLEDTLGNGNDNMTIKSALTRLIKANDLKKLLQPSSQFSQKFRLLEANVGNDTTYYDAGHIETALYVDVLNCANESSRMYPRPVPDLECYKDYLGSLGISNKHSLVVYDRSPFGFYASSRLWWTLKMLGQENVSILNGGLNSWIGSNFELSREKPSFNKEDFFVLSKKKDILRNYEQIRSNKNELILDARPESNFDQGNIPDSVNVPYNELFDETTGLLKSKEQLMSFFKEQGVDFSMPLVTSCQTGMTATSLAFALELVGLKDVPVYAGSWSEYAERAYA